MLALATTSALAMGTLFSGGGALVYMLCGGGFLGAIVIFVVLKMIGGK